MLSDANTRNFETELKFKEPKGGPTLKKMKPNVKA